MGSFNDLPKDVVWIIFRRVFLKIARFPECCEMMDPTTVFQYNLIMFHSDLGTAAWKLAGISRTSLRLMRSKCVKQNKFYWIFRLGALTGR